MDIDDSGFRHLLRSLKEFGTDRDSIARAVERSGLTDSDLDPSTRSVDFMNEVRFVREACDAVGDITFAARSGSTWTTATGIPAYVSKYSRNLRAAMENASRFHDLAGPAFAFALRISGNSASLEFTWKDASYARFHRHTEFIMFGVLSWMREITQTRFIPLQFRFDHEVGKSAETYCKIAGFPVVFGAENLEIVLSLSSLDLPIPTYDLRLREHLTEFGDKLLTDRGSNKPRLRSRIEGQLMASLPGKIVPFDEAAANLGMSPRTLARRLKEDGISYREIVDELRCDLAKTFLKDHMTLSEIAFSLGYADQAGFTTAFKRWTGKAPSRFQSAD